MQSPDRRLFQFTVFALLLLVAWDLSGLDLVLASASGAPGGFPLRENPILTRWLHTGARDAAWVLTVLLALGIHWPWGALRDIPQARRVQLVVSALLATSLVSLLKAGSHTSCPWDLHAFGGVASYMSHWAGWFASDGGAGHCFPGGHASTGFAFVGGYFAFRAHRPSLARAWLASALVAGLVLGIAQQLRGAHFMSHTLWTAWICWTACWAADRTFALRAQSATALAAT